MMSSHAAELTAAASSLGRGAICVSSGVLSRARSTASESKKWREESLDAFEPMCSDGVITVAGWYLGPTLHAAKLIPRNTATARAGEVGSRGEAASCQIWHARLIACEAHPCEHAKFGMVPRRTCSQPRCQR